MSLAGFLAENGLMLFAGTSVLLAVASAATKLCRDPVRGQRMAELGVGCAAAWLALACAPIERFGALDFLRGPGGPVRFERTLHRWSTPVHAPPSGSRPASPEEMGVDRESGRQPMRSIDASDTVLVAYARGDAFANPASASAGVSIEFFTAEGKVLRHESTLRPRSRETLRVKDLERAPRGDFGVRVTSDLPIALERSLYWNPGGVHWGGGHTSPGAPVASTTWYFAEGFTGDDHDTYLAVLNPSGETAKLMLECLTPGGEHNRSVSVEVRPKSRATLHLNTVAGLPDVEVGVVLTSDVPVVCERSMYVSAGGIAWADGHCSLGATSPSQSWFFTGGHTGNLLRSRPKESGF